MRLLFSVNNFGFLRNFEPALRLLAARGHDLHLVAERKDSVGGNRTIDNLRSAYPDRVTFAYVPSRKDAGWQPLATQLRLCLDYWRYLDARYDGSPSLRARAARQAPPFAARLPGWPLIGSRPALAAWQWLFRAVERAIPFDDGVALMRAHNPDLLLLTPLLYFGSSQVEYVRAARQLGVRTVLGVGSWDHLTTKGCIHAQPDRFVVWNEMQRHEASDLHGVPADRVTVTGAQAYDHWFTQQPSTTRAEFAAKVALPAEPPILLYLCSSPFITPYEVDFVRRWIAAVGASADPRVRGASILIRPHPQNAGQWATADLSRLSHVAVWPRAGANPVDRDARADYFDSMYHSAAMVGVNTSALIESGIVGRPVYTVLSDEFSGQQEGTLHFQHLKRVNGGLLHVAATLDEHVAQLSGALVAPDVAKSRSFIAAFVRPHGLELPAADRFADAIEAQAAQPPPPPLPTSLSIRARRVLMRPLALAAQAAAQRRRVERRDPAERAPAGPRRILFVLASPEYLRYYDSTMRLLAERGHHVSVGVNWLREKKHARLDGLLEDDAIEVLGAVPKRLDAWTAFARAVRGTQDFIRYLDPRFADARLLRDRIYRKVLPAYMYWLDRYDTVSDGSRARAMRWLAACERAIPVSGRVRDLLAAQRPDVVVVSPVIDAASDQVDTVRAAQALGIPAVAAIASWDNLTNKGHMRVQPDLVTVWNEHQRREAIELHGVPPDRVAVTGAQLFDRWFGRRPDRSREEFCAQVGLPDTRPFVLFTGSSVFIARSEIEVPFARRWLERLRASDDPRLRDAAVLVRPHPFNGDSWFGADLSELGPVAIWPCQRYTPASEEARSSFFDSLYHCTAVVGVNTSAMIEASILGKPVLSVLTPEFAGTQEGTLHFRYLLPENGGFLRVAHALDAHVAQLREVLQDPEVTRAQTMAFVRTFIRPYGLDTACTPLLADTVQRAAAIRRAPAAETLGTRALRVVLFPVAVLVGWVEAMLAARKDGRRLAYEARYHLVRGARIGMKRYVVRPARALGRFVRPARVVDRLLRLISRLARLMLRAVRRVYRVGRRAAGWCVRRVVRLGRQVHYQTAVRLRGSTIHDEGTDGRP